eukprot:gene47941-25095_t
MPPLPVGWRGGGAVSAAEHAADLKCRTFGCFPRNTSMWTDKGCRADFICDGIGATRRKGGVYDGQDTKCDIYTGVWTVCPCGAVTVVTA